MRSLPDFVGTIHIFFGPYRGNPIGLYLRKEEGSCSIAPTAYPWNRIVGVGETVNKAAADFDAKWKGGDLTTEMYSGPHWEGGIKPEKPKPPPKPSTVAKPQTGEAPKPSKPVAVSKPEAETTAGSPVTGDDSGSPSGSAPNLNTATSPTTSSRTDRSAS